MAVIGLVVIALGVYLFIPNEKSDEPKVSKVDDIKQLVQDYSTGQIQNESASITSEQLIVTDNSKNQTAYALPKDEFFVSIAPYINKTHS